MNRERADDFPEIMEVGRGLMAGLCVACLAIA
jgi:hypothetical protein